MRNVRAAVAAALTLSLFAALSSGPATAAATGVGTASAETTVVAVDLGSNGALLAVRLLGDDARGTIDPKVASAAEAFGRVTGLSVDSSVDALDKSSGRLESKDPGGQKQVTQGSVNLANPAPGVTLPSAVVTGTIGLTSLSSNATATKSVSTIAGNVTNATLGGALAKLQGVSSTLTATAANTASETTRSVKVDQVVVLDLGAFLEGLGLSVLDLPVPTVTALLETLDLDVGSVAADAIVDTVEDLNATIDTVQAQVTTLTNTGLGSGTVGSVVTLVNNTPLGTLIDTTTQATITNATQLIAELQAVIDELQATLSDLLIGAAEVLDGAPLLSVDGLEVTIGTKAADTTGNSSTTRSGKIGSVTVGGVTIPGVDLLATADKLKATVKSVTDELDGVLGTLDDDLAGMVSVVLFEEVAGAGVSTANGYVKAVQGITGLRATVTPPAALATIVDGILALPGVGDVIAAATGPTSVPQLDGAMDDLKVALGTTRSLGGGGSVRLAHVLGTSEFAAATSGTGGPGGGTGGGTPGEADRSLPATGRNGTLPLTALATLLVALGLGFRNWVHMPVRAVGLRTNRTR
ncbi:MAG TPA: hypothetical protein VHF47_05680 [Acidimicrobiales bacterium]|nr:hypothetical protein [Acidimicrobiales bacterium]